MATAPLPLWDSDSFWSGQDFQTSARLHLQHWIWNYQLGYTLHPDVVSAVGQEVKIADIGTGNAAWLLEASRHLPSATKLDLHGFDITPSNYPHTAWLPSNLHLHVWNAFSELPSQWVGAFDVVHMRAMTSTIVDNKVDPLLSNALKMLKPGGFLHWDENDQVKMACNIPDSAFTAEAAQAEAAQMLVRLQQVLSLGQSKLFADWLYGMEATLRERGCEIVVSEVMAPKRELARALTDNYLLVWRDVLRMIPDQKMPLPPNMGLPESLSKQSYAELLQRAVQETSKGASLTMPFHVFIARKKE